jgi:hypothetical protein
LNADLLVTNSAKVPASGLREPVWGYSPGGASVFLLGPVGTPSCWLNPSAFAVPPPGEFGNAGRSILRDPRFAQFDPSLHKDLAIAILTTAGTARQIQLVGRLPSEQRRKAGDVTLPFLSE